MGIDKMPAGREMDARIAELMGWASIALKPSTLEDDAGIVVDDFVATGHAVTVYTGQYQDQGVKSRCCIVWLADLAAGPVDAIADTRPLAICRAALKARERWGG